MIMLPFTPKWFRKKEQTKLEQQQSVIEHKIKRMIELAKSEKGCGKHNIACALVKRLVELNREYEEMDKQIKAIDEGHSPYLS